MIQNFKFSLHCGKDEIDCSSMAFAYMIFFKVEKLKELNYEG